jgi:hypothetical protein
MLRPEIFGVLDISLFLQTNMSYIKEEIT